ncbi:MAG: endonuclease/exonuclease/phosphatase family protein [Bacteroidales bacterium]
MKNTALVILHMAWFSLHVVAQPFSIMTYNIRCGECDNQNANSWQYRKTMVCNIIQKNNPDVIGFQEMIPAQRDYLIENLSGYAYYGTGREADGGGEGCYIFYRTDKFFLDSVHSGTIWYSSTPTIPGSQDLGDLYKRIITYARLKFKNNGQYFYLFNTHMPYLDTIQVKYVDFLVSFVKSLGMHVPFIITGDFNADESSPSIRKLKLSFADENIVDTYRVKFPHDTLTTFNGFSEKRDGRKIDYIFVTANCLHTIAAGCDTTTFNGQYPSDHFPLTATIVFK